MLIIPVISGFTQHDGQWNGCHELAERLLAELDAYSALSVRIVTLPWNANWRHVARQLHLLRTRYHHEPFGVMVCAYSWGVGHGLVKLAKELDRYGIDINIAVTCDGIYRHWYSLGNWRAIFGRHQIVLPEENVKQVRAFYQRVSRPMGLRPVAGESVVTLWEEIKLPHVEMDDAPRFHAECVAVARRQVELFVHRPESAPVGAPDSAAVRTRRNGHG